jgi:hypothetical protein
MQDIFQTGDKVRIKEGTQNAAIFRDPLIILSNLYDSKYGLMEDWYIVFYPDPNWQKFRYQELHKDVLEKFPEQHETTRY